MTPPLNVAFSGKAIFDLRVSDRVFQDEGLDAYLAHMDKYRERPLRPGPAFCLARELQAFNQFAPDPEQPLVSLNLVSQANSTSGIRLLRSLEHYGLDFSRVSFTAGEDQMPFLQALSPDLFLTFNEFDSKRAMACGIPSAQLQKEWQPCSSSGALRIAFDGDAVLFDASSDSLFHGGGLKAYKEFERTHRRRPLPPGPFKPFLEKLCQLRSVLPREKMRLALVTARGAGELSRPLVTLESWGLVIDEAVALCGGAKDKALAAFKPHIFFDDSLPNCLNAARVAPTAQVLS